ncbi:outer membrane beta-barrel protein [Photobacterium alginatilyticum]|uniref:outer membrane beta-barrel protein n=1 Tax=Photobacterium alginatilyticum TaxID=1775171 RepID=UPI0040689824
MKHIKLIAIAMVSLLPTGSFAQDVQTYFGVSYEHGNVNTDNRHTNVDGLKFHAASEMGWGNIKGSSATLTGNGADYDNYTLAVEKPFGIRQSSFFVSPEAGVTYARYHDEQLKESDLGAMVGASLGYNINKQFQIVSNYNHSFGMKSNQANINEDSLSAGLNYRFN